MLKVITDIAVIERWNEIGNAHVAIKSFHAHGELVAKVPHGGQSHAGHAQMFAQGCGGFHVIFVERDDAVDLLCPREMADSWHDVSQGNIRRKIESVVKTLA